MSTTSEELEKYYQVPSKPLAEFNITHDKVYTLTLSDDNIDVNFGRVAQYNEIPLATANETGGFKLYTDDDGSGTATINSLGKQYGVQVRSDGVGFVYVPWLNTIYQAAPTGYLCAECVSLSNGHDGGLFYFDISCVPVTLISGAGNMLSGEYGLFENVRQAITDPLSNEISSLEERFTTKLSVHSGENREEFDNIYTSVDNLSDDLGTNFYRKANTSSDVELYNLFINLSNEFERYLANTLFPTVRTNPSWLMSETSSDAEISTALNNLSNAVYEGYIRKHQSYYCEETSSKVELAQKFDTKQDNLFINLQIDKSLSYTDNDIATVDAIILYIKDLLDTHTATFQGHFDSLTAVPNDGDSTSYIHPVPDENDYIYVNITSADIRVAGFNFTAKDYGVWRMKMVSEQWDSTLGRQNWQPEYKISDSAFTKAQIDAINSGINSHLVSLIMSYEAIRNRLVSEFPNMTTQFGQLALLDRIVDNITGSGKAGQVALFNSANAITGMQFSPTKEKWRFELQDGTTYVEKYILAENV